MRDNHTELDFKAANTKTKNNYPNSQLMRSVVNKYTPACFAFIHKQYDLSFKYYYKEDTTKGSDLIRVFNVFTIEKVHDPDELDDDKYDDADNEGGTNADVMDEELQDHDRLDERVVTVDVRSKSFSCTCRMFENRGFLCRHVFKILEFLGGSVQYHSLKTIPAQYVLKRWTRDVRPSADKLKSIISAATEDTTQAQAQ